MESVKVCVRLRPLIEREEKASAEDAEPVQMFWKADHKSIQQIDDGNSGKSFVFDRVFTADENTNQLYQSFAKPLVESAVEGYNGTIFAYGQTSSGKTFTMMGSSGTPGVIPLAVEDVFQTIKNFPKKEFLLRVSYMEIYNETVTDLLVDSWKRKPLEVREASNKNIYVADLTEEVVTSPAQALNWIRKGEKNRHYGQTKMNHRSSRSHTIFRMILESRDRSDPASGENADGAIIVSHLNLVDLAGSERASQTGAEGARFKEGCNINRSLFTLGQVIKKLTDENQKGFTNYRDSKLTRILQNSLGGNAKTVIICTITAAALEDTLSTLQFASTAKKMKNDPHVTEVSDDGALLKRYRNEIVDLKRRLQEVSSITQTTATEKEVLSQLLQEKDQLQREQEDRIKNLTRLLVTSSNQVTAPKRPKRRVTWGGQMLRLAHPSVFNGGISELSFAEPFSRKRKGDCSTLSEMAGDDEDFQWEIPEELSEDTEINQSSVVIGSFGESPKDFMSPDRMHELSGKVSNLEQQLELEVQQREEAMMKVETAEGRVSELEQQLELEVQRREEATMKVETAEGRVSELEQQLETEVQQKLEALEKVEMMEVRASDQERQLEEMSHSPSGSDDQMKQEFAETIQLCEHLASEKEMLAAERDYLKQELGMFIEQMESLEKEKAELSKELEEKRETDEFKSLEEEFRKEHENELLNEISTLKAAVEASELQRQELQNKMDALSQELKRKSDFVEELQNMSGKDLVQEVEKLRRSLNDAEGVSRDTKKEWAHLRSQNITLEEANEMLTKNHDKMEAEVNSLRFQLESEKTRFRQMQSDLQRELNVVFDENTKLTTLLDGKVPQNLKDRVELERAVADLNKELTAAREAESTLRAQTDSLTQQLCDTQTHRDALVSAQTQSEEEVQRLRDALQVSQEDVVSARAELSSAALTEEQLKVDVETLRQTLEESEEEKLQLTSVVQEKQSKLTESEEQREALQEKLNEMQQLGKDLEEKLADSEVSRATEEEISKELQEQLNQLTQELQAVRAEKDVLLNDKGQSSEETEKMISAERDQLRNELQRQEEMAAETRDLVQSLQNELQQQRSNLEEQVKSLSEQLHSVGVEKETFQHEAQTSAEEAEKLLSTVSSLTAERDQLQTDMQENVEMMIENQAELRTALEKNAVQKELIKQLQAEKTARQDDPSPSDTETLELQMQLCAVRGELQSALSERDALLRERTADSHSQSEEMEELQRRLTSLSEDRDQLQESVDALRQQKQQLREDMEDQIHSLQTEVFSTQEHLKSVQEKLQENQQVNSELKREHQEKEETRAQQINTLTEELQRVSAEKEEQVKSLSEQLSEARAEREARDGRSSVEMEELQDTVSTLRRERQQLTEETEDRISTLQAEICAVRGELQSALSERDALLRERTAYSHSQSEEMEELQRRLTSVSEDRDQLQESVDALRQQKQQLREDMEDQIHSLQTEICAVRGELQSALSERDALLRERTADSHSQSEEMEELQRRLTSLSEDRDQLQESVDALRQQKQQLREDMEDQIHSLQAQICAVRGELQSALSERDALLRERTADSHSQSEEMEELQRRLTSVSEDRDQLQESVDALRQQKQQLREDMEDQIHSLQTQLCAVRGELQSVLSERDALLRERTADSHSQSEEMEELQRRLTSLSEDRDQLQESVDALRQQKQQLREDMEDQIHSLQTQVSQLSGTLQTLTEQKRELEDSLQESINTTTSTQGLLKSVQEQLQEQQQMNSDLVQTRHEEQSAVAQQINTLTEELQRVSAEKEEQVKSLSEQLSEARAEREARDGRSSVEMEELQDTVSTLRRERQRLTEETEDRISTLQAEIEAVRDQLQSVASERDALLRERTASSHSQSEEMEKLQERLSSVTEEREQLQHSVSLLKAKMALLTDETKERVDALQEEIEAVRDQLQSVASERDALLRERTASSHSQSEEMEKLQERLSSVTEEREQLQHSVSLLKAKMALLTDETKERVDALQEEVQQLEEKLRVSQEKQAESRRDADGSLQRLTEAKETISALKDQLSSLDQNSRFKETAASRLQESADHFQELFRQLEDQIDKSSRYNRAPLGRRQTIKDSKLVQPTHWPQQTKDAHKAFFVLGQQCVHVLDKYLSAVPARLRDYIKLFEELMKSELDIFEERRLQDVLLCRAQAGTLSVQDQDFNSLWEQRLTELLDTRKLLVQKATVVWKKVNANTVWFAEGMRDERLLREQFDEQMDALSAKKPNNFSELDAFLSREQDSRSALLSSRKAMLPVIEEEHRPLLEELRQLQTQTSARLKDERGKTSTLLQALKGAPLRTEVSLLKENQQLALQLQQTSEEVKALCAQRDQLEEAQAKASNMLSNHKEATQLLQTELQDSRANVEDKENVIQSLRSKLRESEKNASPSAVEMEKLRSKLFKVELELRSASDKHQQEIQRMTALLKEKELSLRKLKETLRITQQQGDQSILQGQDLHNRLTDPRGLTLKSVQQEKTKLEEEVHKLRIKITEMESLVSSQQAEITKWKSRAVKLKTKTQADTEKPSPPRTPTKRGFSAITGPATFYSSPKKVLDSPRKVLDSPRKVLDTPRRALDSPKVNTLDSPKSRFFDAGGGSDLLSRTYPKQFFDNSSLGTVPDVSHAPEPAAAETGAGGSAHKKAEWWPEAPEMEECCKAQ